MLCLSTLHWIQAQSIAKLLIEFASVVGNGYSYCPHGRSDFSKQQTVGIEKLLAQNLLYAYLDPCLNGNCISQFDTNE